MNKIICMGLALAAFSLTAPAQDWKSAIDGLPKYEFGQSRTFIEPLHEAIQQAGGDAAKLKPIAAALGEMLSGEASTEGKREALRALGPIATAAEVPVLVKLLPDADVGEMALWDLERVSDPSAAKALLDALAAAPADQKAKYILALGWRKEAIAAEALTAALSGPEADALAAAAALARIDSPAACAAAAEKRAGAKGKLRAALSDLALVCAERALATPEGKASAVATYEQLMAEGEPGHLRGAALNGLVKAEPEKALERVIQAFTGKDADLALVAAGFVRDLKADGATQAFAALIGEAPAATQGVLIDALADRGDAAAHDAVAKALNSGDEYVKLAAVRALGKIGNQDDTAKLAALAADAGGDLKRAAETSLNTLPGAGVDEDLAALAANSDAKLRSAAITALTERRAVGVRSELMKLLNDGDDDTRAEVYAALEVLCDETDMSILLKKLSANLYPKDVPMLEKVIMAVCNRIPDESKRAAAVTEELAKSAGTEHRVSLLHILGGVPTKESLDAIRDAMATDDARVRLSAVETLSAWPTDATVGDLVTILQSPPSDAERSAALGGYVRLLRENKTISPAHALQEYELAISYAANAEEKKQMVAGLASVPDKHALDLLQILANEPDLANETASGMVSVLRLISGAYPELAKARLTAFTSESTPAAIKAPAQAALGLLGGLEDYVTAWQVSGPYFETGKSAHDLFEMAFPPEQGTAEDWRIVPLANVGNSSGLAPWAVDLNTAIGGQERVAYLRTWLTAEKATEGVLELGTNDGCKVWLNGKLLHSFKEGRPLKPGDDKIALSLNEGKNELLIAVYQQGDAWAACARLADKDGKALAGVTASAE